MECIEKNVLDDGRVDRMRWGIDVKIFLKGRPRHPNARFKARDVPTRREVLNPHDGHGEPDHSMPLSPLSSSCRSSTTWA